MNFSISACHLSPPSSCRFLEDGSAGVSSDIKELAKRWEPKNNTEKSSKIDLKSVDSGAVAFSSSSSLPKYVQLLSILVQTDLEFHGGHGGQGLCCLGLGAPL